MHQEYFQVDREFSNSYFTSFTTSNCYIVRPFNDDKCFIIDLPPDLDSVMDYVKSQNLSIDILINNAGYGRWGELTSFERDDYAEMLQLNVVTLTDLCHLYLPDMVRQGGGGIINVGSMASLAPIPYASIYSSSKAYVLMFF